MALKVFLHYFSLSFFEFLGHINIEDLILGFYTIELYVSFLKHWNLICYMIYISSWIWLSIRLLKSRHGNKFNWSLNFISFQFVIVTNTYFSNQIKQYVGSESTLIVEYDIDSEYIKFKSNEKTFLERICYKKAIYSKIPTHSTQNIKS